MDIKPFGKIDNGNLEEYYDGKIKIGGTSVGIDLNFESDSVAESVLGSVSNFIAKIDEIAAKSFTAISEDYELDEESGTARFYLQHHIDELSAQEIKSIFGTTEVNKSLFLDKLSLRRIGLYPEDDESFAIFDIQLPDEFTNYLMAVTFDSKGKLSDISMES